MNGVFPLQNCIGMKRKSPEPDDNIPTTTMKPKIVKKTKVQKKKKKRDPNEPQKSVLLSSSILICWLWMSPFRSCWNFFWRPVSAYALFFRDTQAAIKGQNPNASFGEVSKIVASMWDGLDVDHKNVTIMKVEEFCRLYWYLYWIGTFLIPSRCTRRRLKLQRRNTWKHWQLTGLA